MKKQKETNPHHIYYQHLTYLLTRGQEQQALLFHRSFASQHLSPAEGARVEADLAWACNLPQARTLYLQAAYLYVHAGDQDGACAVYRQLLSLHAADAEALAQLLVLADDHERKGVMQSMEQLLADGVLPQHEAAHIMYQVQRRHTEKVWYEWVREQCPGLADLLPA